MSKKSTSSLIFLALLLAYLSLMVSGCATLLRSPKDTFIEIPNPKLPEYQELTYQVRWLGLPVGKIIASIKGIHRIRGRNAYLLEVVIKTNDFCSKIYKMDDRFLSYMDAENLYTLRHEVYRREGRYKKDAITDFDQDNHKAYFKNLLDKSEKVFDIPPNIQDTLSACYYFMLLPIKVGERIEYAVCNNESNYQLFGLVRYKTFLNLPKLGIKEAFLLQPYAKLNDKDVKKGRIAGYFSCDKSRIPLFITIKAPVFTKVTASLYKAEFKNNNK